MVRKAQAKTFAWLVAISIQKLVAQKAHHFNLVLHFKISTKMKSFSTNRESLDLFVSLSRQSSLRSAWIQMLSTRCNSHVVQSLTSTSKIYSQQKLISTVSQDLHDRLNCQTDRALRQTRLWVESIATAWSSWLSIYSRSATKRTSCKVRTRQWSTNWSLRGLALTRLTTTVGPHRRSCVSSDCRQVTRWTSRKADHKQCLCSRCKGCSGRVWWLCVSSYLVNSQQKTQWAQASWWDSCMMKPT